MGSRVNTVKQEGFYSVHARVSKSKLALNAGGSGAGRGLIHDFLVIFGSIKSAKIVSYACSSARVY